MRKVQTEINNPTIRNPNSTLPEGWRWVKLSEVCEIDSKQVLPNTPEAKQLPYVGLEHIESGTGKILSTVDDPDGKLIQSTTFQFDSCHVLYGKLRPYLNKVATPNFEGRCTTELLPLLPTNGHNRCYLAWLLRRTETVEEAMRNKTGTRMPRADMKNLFRMLVPLPTLSEQKRIASKLQELMQEVERARKSCEKQLEAAKALLSAYLREVFESEEAKKWERKRLGEVCGIYQPQTITSKEILESGLYKVFGANGVIGYYDKYNHEDAEVLITCRGATCGTVNFSEPKSWITGNAMVVKPKNNSVDKQYLFYILKHFDFKPAISGSAQPQITRTSLSPFKIPFSTLPEQKKIATELKDKMAQIENLQSAIQNQQSALNALPQAILRKAFRGEL